jgi:predicted ATPase/ABC-type dipeptide/oligopeptide/nickel transport system ATPase component
MKCPECGFRNAKATQFCGKCGARIAEVSHSRAPGDVSEPAPVENNDSNAPLSPSQKDSPSPNCSDRKPVDILGNFGLTRFLGRQRELKLLRRCFEECKAGKGQVVSIVGEAGIGKSRLLHEFRKSLKDENVTYLQGNCHPRGKQRPYYPVIDLLRANFQIEGGDKDAEIREKVRTGLRMLGIKDKACLPYIFELLSIEKSGIEKIASTPEETKNKINEVLGLIARKGAEIRPVVLAVEDWHWTDQTSAEATEHLLKSIASARIMLMFSYRPFSDSWSPLTYHTQISLSNLSNHDTLTMTADLFGVKRLDGSLKDLILHNTRGVPFFVEEFIGFLNNLRIVERKGDRCHLVRDIKDMSVPDTIQDVITSRIESLPQSARDLLLAGSVVGRQFGYQLIARMTELPDYELESRLSVLRYSGFLYERGRSPQSIYVFKHALIQDACHRLLSDVECKNYHAKIAQFLQQDAPESAHDEPEKLGHHLTEAGFPEQAIPYWQRAAEIAIRRSAIREGISYLGTALDTVRKLPESPQRTRLELDLQIALGPALMAMNGYGAPEVEAVYSRARQLCEQSEETPKLFTVLRGLWGYYVVRGELETAYELGDRCVALARRARKQPLALWAHYAVGMTLYHLGEFTSALDHFEKGMDLYDVRKRNFQRALQDPGVACLSYRALTQWIIGYPDQALRTSQDAVNLAKSLNHPFSMAYALSIEGLVNQFCRNVQESRRQAEAAESLCRERSISYWFAWGPILRGWAMTTQGEGKDGIKEILRGLAAYSSTGAEIARPLFLGMLADAYRKVGKTRDGLAAIAQGLDKIRETGDRFYEPELHRLKGELLLATHRDHRSDAEACFRHALSISRERNARSFELRAAMSLNRLRQGSDNSGEVRKLLKKAYGWFSEGFDSPDLKEARLALDQPV